MLSTPSCFVQPQFRQRALVIGAGWAGRTLVESLGNVTYDANPFRGTGYELVGFIDDNPELTGGQVVGVPVLVYPMCWCRWQARCISMN